MVNQPNNTLINHLHKELHWFAPGSVIMKSKKFSSSSIPFFEKILKILLKNGVIYTHHLFFGKFFFRLDLLLSLPTFINDDTFPKFYRFVKLTAKQLVKVRQSVLTRKFINFLSITNLNIYKKSSFIIVLLNLYLPKIRIHRFSKYNRRRNARYSVNQDAYWVNYRPIMLSTIKGLELEDINF